MEKVKQEGFSNFNYGIIKSIDNRCVDVKCTYNYKGKTLTHYFSYAKQGNKSNSYYIDRAKADMDKLIKDKKAESVAKKDLKGSKATFFKRHKKPILIATTAVLVAGIATAATLITLKYTGNDSTAVTETEIDKYLEGPAGNTTHLNPLFVDKILAEAQKNIGDKNLKGFETKMLTSMPVVDVIDRFISKTTSNENPSNAVKNPSEMLNDTSEFYTNSQFKNKNYYGSYLKGRLLEDQKQTYAASMHSFDNYTGLKNGSNVSSKSEALTTFKHTTNPDSSEGADPFITFANRKYVYNGYSGPNMVASKKIGSFETEAESSDAIFDDFTEAALTLCAGGSDIFKMYKDRFRVTEDGSTVFLKYEADITQEIVESGEFPLRSLMGVPVKYHAEAVWYFKNVDKLGWVLDSFASDGLIYNLFNTPVIRLPDETSYLLAPAYVEYNEKGEKLDKPVCINKDKGFTKLSYGDLDKDKSIDDIIYTKSMSVEAPASASAMYGNSGTGEKGFPAEDITLVRRIDNPKFNGYSLLGTVAPDPLCVEGSSVLFQYIPDSENKDPGNPIILDYAVLKDYLNQDIFEEGEKIKDPSGKEYTLIKLKKAGWFTYELVLDDKLQFSNIIINFHEGPSPIIDR